MHRLARVLRRSCGQLAASWRVSRAAKDTGLRDDAFYFAASVRRGFATAPVAAVQSPKPAGQNAVKVTFVQEGKTYEAYGKDGDTLLDLIINNELDFDGFGACEGTLACSTCHVVLEKKDYDAVPNKPCDEEMDMLDLAYDLTDTHADENAPENFI